MNYNKTEILNMIAQANFLDPTNDFYEIHNYDFIHYMGEAFYHNYEYANGATKLVLIPRDNEKDYVIKIPYTGCGQYTSSWYSGNYYHKGYEEYYPFQYAESDDYEWDYCAGEMNRYIIAEDEGFGQCFAKTLFLGYVNDYPIYIQERGVTFDETRGHHQHSLLEKTHTQNICKYIRCMNIDWLTDFKLYYGEAMLINFLSFLNIMGWNNDLRDQNIGYIGDRPVLIDYSGFLE